MLVLQGVRKVHEEEESLGEKKKKCFFKQNWMEVKQYRSIHAYVCVGGKSLNFNFVCKFELLKDTTLALLFAQSIEASLGRVSSHSMCKNRLYCPCLGCGLL